MKFTSILFFAAVHIWFSVAAAADELEILMSGFETDEAVIVDSELDELLGGFEEKEEITGEDGQAEHVLPDWLELQGSLSLQSTVNFAHSAPPSGTPDYRGLSMFRTIGELISDAHFSSWRARFGATLFYDAAYTLNDQRDLYTREYLDEYEKEFEIQEVYLHGSLADNIDLKFGRQIVVWGKSDNIRVTDILNPLDNRWPGMVDIRFLRLPVTMSRLDYYIDNWNLSTILIHEPRFNKFPVFNGEFYPFEQPAPPVDEPDISINQQQLGLALNGIFSGWDLSLYAASVFDTSAHTEFDPASSPVRKHERVSMVGFAANVALGNWLVKTEAAYWDGLKFTTVSEEKSRLDLLAGLEYAGFTDTAISLEFANRHLFDFDQQMEQIPDAQQQDWIQYAIRFVRDFMNDTVHLTFLISSYGLFGSDGGFERLQVEYDITDVITLTGGVVFYEAGDFLPFREIGDNDRLLFELEYRF